jgi:hypothetical protein
MGGAEFVRFARIQSGMDSTEHDDGAAAAREPADFESAQSVGGMNADSDNIAGL